MFRIVSSSAICRSFGFGRCECDSRTYLLLSECHSVSRCVRPLRDTGQTYVPRDTDDCVEPCSSYLAAILTFSLFTVKNGEREKSIMFCDTTRDFVIWVYITYLHDKIKFHYKKIAIFSLFSQNAFTTRSKWPPTHDKPDLNFDTFLLLIKSIYFINRQSSHDQRYDSVILLPVRLWVSHKTFHVFAPEYFCLDSY